MSGTSFGETFLEVPDLFPERESGEPWGDRELIIDLPGGPYRFVGLDHLQEARVRQRMGCLCLEANENLAPLVETRVFRAAESDFRRIDQRGWIYSLDLDCHPDSLRIAGRDFIGRLDWSSALRGALWTPSGGTKFDGVFENFFRVLFSYRLLESGGVLIHSAAVVDDDGAYLFFGHSGAGKSTVSRISLDTGRRVLSDDMNALRRAGSITMVDKVPFVGELGDTSGQRASHPLRAICRLQKGAVNAVEPLGRAEAIASLLSCSPNVNVNPYRLDRLVSNLESLVGSVPTCELTFTRDGGLWDVLKRRITS